jgi:hypothetical protein
VAYISDPRFVRFCVRVTIYFVADVRYCGLNSSCPFAQTSIRYEGLAEKNDRRRWQLFETFIWSSNCTRLSERIEKRPTTAMSLYVSRYRRHEYIPCTISRKEIFSHLRSHVYRIFLFSLISAIGVGTRAGVASCRIERGRTSLETRELPSRFPS